MGRPSELTDSMMEKAHGFLDWVDANPIKDKDGKDVERTPKLITLARFLGVDRNTVTNWRKVSEEFDAICNEINDRYEEKLVDFGLAGVYQPRVATFLLSADHGKREKSDVTTDGKELPTPILHLPRE